MAFEAEADGERDVRRYGTLGHCFSFLVKEGGFS